MKHAIAALLGAFVLTGCATLQTGYSEYVKPAYERAKTATKQAWEERQAPGDMSQWPQFDGEGK